MCGTCAVKLSPALHDQTLQGSKEKGLLRRKGKANSEYSFSWVVSVGIISLVKRTSTP